MANVCNAVRRAATALGLTTEKHAARLEKKDVVSAITLFKNECPLRIDGLPKRFCIARYIFVGRTLE